MKQAALSLSIAQFSFWFVSKQVFGFASNPAAGYYQAGPPPFSMLFALFTDILLLAFALLIAFHLCVSRSRLIRILATTCIGICVVFSALQLIHSIEPVFRHTALFRWAAIVSGLGIFLLRPGFARRAATFAYIITSPLFPIASITGLHDYWKATASAYGPGSAAGMLPQAAHHNRVIWIVFDELDEDVLFTNRPARLHLDEFDRFRAQSIFATQVSSPNPSTMPSMISLVLGRHVTTFKPDSAKLDVQLDGSSSWKNFAAEPNVFRTARSEGFNTALVGWHHPYCRLIGNDLSVCKSYPGPQFYVDATRDLEARNFIGKAIYLTRWQARNIPVIADDNYMTVPGGIPTERRYLVLTYQGVMQTAESMLRNPNLNLVLVHMPTPHPPGIWNVARQSVTTDQSNYVDNVQLANESLRRLLRAVDESGAAGDTTVLVSSDHPYRTDVWQSRSLIRTQEMLALMKASGGKRIPFLVHLPQQSSQLTYSKPFNSRITADWLLAALKGQFPNPERVVDWLDVHTNSEFQPVQSARAESLAAADQ